MDYIDYKIGDSVWFKGGYINASSKKRLFGKGFVTEDFIKSQEKHGRIWKYTKDRTRCKTNFSVTLGSGVKNFYKEEVSSVKLLLIEKKNNYQDFKIVKIFF